MASLLKISFTSLPTVISDNNRKSTNNTSPTIPLSTPDYKAIQSIDELFPLILRIIGSYSNGDSLPTSTTLPFQICMFNVLISTIKMLPLSSLKDFLKAIFQILWNILYNKNNKDKDSIPDILRAASIQVDILLIISIEWKTRIIMSYVIFQLLILLFWFCSNTFRFSLPHPIK